MSKNDVVIVAAKRTPIGAFMGSLAQLPATELGARAIAAAVAQCGIDVTTIEEAFMGCVLPAGCGQAPARQAVLAAGLLASTGATTINKVCGSGLKAVMLAHDLIRAGSANTVIAGGMESMSRAPYLLPKARSGLRMGHSQILDHMMLDGLENAYDGKAMGCFAQDTADSHQIRRDAMDDFARRSLQRAQKATRDGAFNAEITEIKISSRTGDLLVENDEGPLVAKPEKISDLKPAFSANGTITAANASSISDGAAALIIMNAAQAKAQELTPLARILGHATHSIAPEDFTIAPIGAINKLLEKLQWQASDVDLFEINEAFAMVTMLAIDKLGLDENNVNIHGGACALGHPIGASGARILVTLIHALRAKGLSRGIAALCIGGGEACAIAVEVV